MTREEFIRQERDAALAFYARHPDDDQQAPATYSRQYRCGCGYRTDDAGAIYDHAAACTEDA